MNGKKTVVAIMYDFDKTLTTKDMQEYTFIPKVGMTASEFWGKSDVLAREQGMDRILAYMKLMLDEATSHGHSIHRDDFVALGRDLEFFPGVRDWFNHIQLRGQALGVEIQHYIISSGLREIIEGSAIGAEFRRIYASEYLYGRDGIAQWPKLAVNFTAKTQFLFRINKGVLDVYEDTRLNDHTPEDERAIPFRNMVYIGDGLTDVPCMKLVKSNGGKSIAVYQQGSMDVCKKLMRENRIDYYALADYSDGAPLSTLVAAILRKIKAEEDLVQLHNTQAREAWCQAQN
ncbi:MAG: phosphoserine phosphatase [Spirochaetae bacterium HGW-Spirochaetae-8]|nr:MAG: phosphoserine phosphatase [Spirochaetae bacterium HGW-Spirochaetae-8]